MGISMVSPLLPVFAEDLGATGVWIGLTFSIFAVTQTLVSPFVGGWSDRHGRKPFIIGGLLLYFVAALGYLTADTFAQVLAFRALSGCGTSLIFSVARAYVGDFVPPGHEGRWFGIFATADIVGFGLGPLLAGGIREWLGFDAVFVAMAVLMASSALIVWTLLPRQAVAERYTGDTTGSAGLASLRALRVPLVAALTLNMGLISLSFGSTFSFLAVRLEDLGIGPFIIGLAFSMESLASGASQPFFGRLADLRDRRRLVAIGLGVTSVMLFSLGLVESIGLVMALMFGMGLGGGLALVASSALQVEAGRSVGMGTVNGLGSAGNGVGVVFGSVTGGLIVDAFSAPAAFFFAGVAMASGIPLFLWLTRTRPPAAPAEATPVVEREVAG